MSAVLLCCANDVTEEIGSVYTEGSPLTLGLVLYVMRRKSYLVPPDISFGRARALLFRPLSLQNPHPHQRCVLYEMLSLTHAFEGRNETELAMAICEREAPSVNCFRYSAGMGYVVKRLLKKKPLQRPSCRDILLRRPFIETVGRVLSDAQVRCHSPLFLK